MLMKMVMNIKIFNQIKDKIFNKMIMKNKQTRILIYKISYNKMMIIYRMIQNKMINPTIIYNNRMIINLNKNKNKKMIQL